MTGVYAAVVGSYLVHFAADSGKLAPQVAGIVYVDSLDAFIPWLRNSGAERVLADWLPADHDEFDGKPRAVTGGRNAYFRHPDGALMEYFEADPATTDRRRWLGRWPLSPMRIASG